MFAVKNTIETCICKTIRCWARVTFRTYSAGSLPVSVRPRRMTMRRHPFSHSQAQLFRGLHVKESEVYCAERLNLNFSYAAGYFCRRRFVTSDEMVKDNFTHGEEHAAAKDTDCVSIVKESESDEQSDSLQAVSDQDIDEELRRYDYENVEDISDETVIPQQISKKPLPISLARGRTGVFDVDELVALLEDENARDVCVLPVPPEYHYVDYLVVATGRSTRHLKAMAEFIKWMYKRKHSSDDPPSVRIEGEQCKDWFAMDLGNIAVHLFLHDTRRHYDLETLWTEGYTAESDAVDDHVTLQRQDFSFDAELERLRRLKEVRRESIAQGVAMETNEMTSAIGVNGENVVGKN